MTFWKINKVTVTLAAAFVMLVGGAYISSSDCGSGCMLSSVFTAQEAVAGPGCSADAKAACASKSATTASATEAKVSSVNATEGAGCDKEACITKCMADKGLTRAEAEACYAKCQQAKATGVKSSDDCAKSCASKSATSAAKVTTANATEGAGCDKEACISKCMADKGLTRAEAEACYAKCQQAKATGVKSSDACAKSCAGNSVNIIKSASATDGAPSYSREAYIDACVAKGMSKDAAVKAADEKGLAKTVDAKAAGCCATKAANAAKASATDCAASCASKAKAGATTASAKASDASN